MIWDELAKIALIGTERAQLSENTLSALAKLGINAEGNPAKAILEAAALYHSLRRAGFPLQKQEPEFKPIQPEESSPANRASGRSAR